MPVILRTIESDGDNLTECISNWSWFITSVLYLYNEICTSLTWQNVAVLIFIETIPKDSFIPCRLVLFQIMTC